jgi:hypothetical protein
VYIAVADSTIEYFNMHITFARGSPVYAKFFEVGVCSLCAIGVNCGAHLTVYYLIVFSICFSKGIVYCASIERSVVFSKNGGSTAGCAYGLGYYFKMFNS